MALGAIVGQPVMCGGHVERTLSIQPGGVSTQQKKTNVSRALAHRLSLPPYQQSAGAGFCIQLKTVAPLKGALRSFFSAKCIFLLLLQMARSCRGSLHSVPRGCADVLNTHTHTREVASFYGSAGRRGIVAGPFPLC